MPNYETLQNKYGDVIALSILIDIERHLRLNSVSLATVDPAVRFQSAIDLMGDAPVCCAA